MRAHLNGRAELRGRGCLYHPRRLILVSNGIHRSLVCYPKRKIKCCGDFCTIYLLPTQPIHPPRNGNQITNMADTNPSVALIEQLSKLAPKLADGDNVEARNEAIQLSRQLTGSLSHPASSAVELAFAVCIEISLSQWEDANVFGSRLLLSRRELLLAWDCSSSLLTIRVLLAPRNWLPNLAERSY